MTENTRDPRKDPRKGDVIKHNNEVKTVAAVSTRKQGGMVVRFNCSFGGNGCESGLSAWRSYYRKAEVLHVAEEIPNE